MRRTVLLAVAAAGSLLAVPLPGQAGEVTTHVVDDDRAQCAQADHFSIGAAVAAADAGDLVRVCAGNYRERVVVDKTIVIQGQPDEVQALDCFAAAPSVLGDLDTTMVPVLSPPDALAQPVVRLEADGVDVSGLVVEGMVDAGVDSIYRASLETSPLHSGYRVHHNLFRLNTLGMETTSNGSALSRFDHNCLRENRWGAANQRFTLTNARFDHNETFRHTELAFEIGWVRAAMDDVLLDHNVGRQDVLWAAVARASGIRLEDNTSSARLWNIALGNESIDITVARNSLAGGTVGVLFRGASLTAPPHRSTAVVVQENTIVGMAGAPGLAVFIAGTHLPAQLTVLDNVLSDNVASGLRVGRGSGNTFARNVMERNGSYGAWVGPLATDNTFMTNVMLGNGLADARDDTSVVDGAVSNDWINNACVSDIPDGLLCGTFEQP